MIKLTNIKNSFTIKRTIAGVMILAWAGVIIAGYIKANMSSQKDDQQMVTMSAALAEENPKDHKPESLKNKAWSKKVFSYNPGKAFKGYYYVESGLPKKTSFKLITFKN